MPALDNRRAAAGQAQQAVEPERRPDELRRRVAGADDLLVGLADLHLGLDVLEREIRRSLATGRTFHMA